MALFSVHSQRRQISTTADGHTNKHTLLRHEHTHKHIDSRHASKEEENCKIYKCNISLPTDSVAFYELCLMQHFETLMCAL